MQRKNPVTNSIGEYIMDICSLPFLIITGPCIGNPASSVALTYKLVKIGLTTITFIIFTLLFFSSIGQFDEKLIKNVEQTTSQNPINYTSQNDKVKSFLDTYKSSLKSSTTFSDKLYEFVKNKAGEKTPAGNNPPVLYNQCVSLVRIWQYSLGGGDTFWFGGYPIPAYRAYKSGVKSIAYGNQKYSVQIVENVNALQAGDLVIMTGIPSHTGIATGRASQKTYELFDENSPQGSAPTINEYSKTQFIGALRYLNK